MERTFCDFCNNGIVPNPGTRMLEVTFATVIYDKDGERNEDEVEVLQVCSDCTRKHFAPLLRLKVN